jgi:DNA invertase Pin-like site-specific DNA recombinase
MATGKFVSYLRVSTKEQGNSGLGLEAQREAVARYLNGGRWELAKEYVEIESGKDDNRPKLAAALAHAKALKARLVVAKLDRLSRDVTFIATLQKSGVKFVVADNPEANELTIHILAAVAQHERTMIRDRTKAALAVARERVKKKGQKGRPDVKRLGNPNGAAAFGGKRAGTEAALAMIRINAAGRAESLRAIVEDIREAGITSTRKIAQELTRRAVPAARGAMWHRSAVRRLLARLAGY